MNKIIRVVALGAVATGMSVAALAHHSFAAIFDANKELKISGTLTKVEWINPHSYFYVDVKDSSGKVTTWAFENFPPAMLARLGFKRDTMVSNIGKEVTVSYNPALKAGEPLGYGRVFTFKGAPPIEFTAPDANGNAATN
jgi:hypothetical protein